MNKESFFLITKALFDDLCNSSKSYRSHIELNQKTTKER